MKIGDRIKHKGCDYYGEIIDIQLEIQGLYTYCRIKWDSDYKIIPWVRIEELVNIEETRDDKLNILGI